MNKAVRECRSLDDLARALRGSGSSPSDVDRLEGLPTFGGKSPADLRGVHSWDRVGVLVSFDGCRLCILDRAALPNLWRNLEIERRWSDGETYAAIGRDCGVSVEGVRMILGLLRKRRQRCADGDIRI